MPACQFNEREFENVINHELASLGPYLVGGLPVLPSQVAEKSLGYDAAYTFTSGKRFFLQYKVSSFSKQRTGSNQDIYDAWAGPYLRSWLLTDKESGMPHQHNLLVDLAAAGEEVFYCAPLFHELKDLSHHAAVGETLLASLLAPLQGAPRLGLGRHSFSYPRSGGWWRLHSEMGAAHSASRGEDVLRLSKPRPFDRDEFSNLLTLVGGLLAAQEIDIRVPRFAVELGPLAELDWLLSRYLGAVLVLLPDRRETKPT